MSLLDQGNNNLFAALARVRLMLDLSNTVNKFNCDLDVTEDGLAIFSSGLIEATSTAPRCYWCITTDQKFLVFVNGVETAAQGQALWNAYTDTSQLHGQQPNAWYSQAARELKATINAVVTNRSEIILCGYSAGGGVVLEMLRQWRAESSPACPVNVITFGSPKPVSRFLMSPMNPGSCSAWFNSDDPVPLVPPSISTYTRVMAGLSYWQGQNIAAYDRWPGGVNVDLNGLVRPMAQPSQLATPATEQIGAWLRNQSQGVQNAHSLATYVARLTLAVSLRTPATSVVAPVLPSPSHESVSGPVIRRAIASTVQTQFFDASRQNATPVYIPPQKLFTVSKKNKVYSVNFGGVQVAIAPFRRRAHGLARIGNDFLRRMQNEGIVYTDNLAQQFALYLQAAADPASGIRPTMNTTTSG